MTNKGVIYSTLSAICYASGVIFVRFAYKTGITPGTAIFLRFSIAFIVLWVILRVSDQWQPVPTHQKRALFLLGLIAYTTLGVTWFVSLSITPAWLVSLFVSLYPLAISLASWLFFHETIHRNQVIALSAVLTGSLFLFWQPFEGKVNTGIFLMIINIITNVIYILIGRRYTVGISPMLASFWMILGAAAGTLGYALISRQLSFEYQPLGWIWAFLLAIVSTALAITFLWAGINYLGPSKASIVGSLEPVFAISLAVLLLGERLNSAQAVGGIFILFGVMWVRR